ncbi:DUF3800 domain-containing protein [Microbacterium sp. MYb64]|uniref:DUF3800 domain-containing protein n=1 Tax=Microbacterium sp. MYb64 TaxID=1848691 RepID=UPI002157B229|nr:DUF3800 domain-containing protein [Microbacterium sp. MYb64]
MDESGDHGLNSINPDFPVFTLAFCVFRKTDYIDSIVPTVERLKFDFWGHDAVVLHEADIRKQTGAFSLLRRSPALRASFFERLNGVIAGAPFDVIAATIDKHRLLAKYPTTAYNPYEVALLFCMERLLEFLANRFQTGRTVQIIFESRGKNEDRDLEVEFRRICTNGGSWGYRRMDFRRMSFEALIVPKAANSSGLQLADLVARPIALRTLRPDQPNRAYELIEPKLRYEKVFP